MLAEDPLAVLSGMIEEMMSWRFTPDWNNPQSVMAACERHNESVRQGVAPGRLLEWKPSDGWEPLCAALEVPVPKTAFLRKNSTKEFRGRRGLACECALPSKRYGTSVAGTEGEPPPARSSR